MPAGIRRIHLACGIHYQYYFADESFLSFFCFKILRVKYANCTCNISQYQLDTMKVNIETDRDQQYYKVSQTFYHFDNVIEFEHI